jgi:hypothetical protein
VQVAELDREAALLAEESFTCWRQPASTSKELVVLGLADGAGGQVTSCADEVGRQDAIGRHHQEVRARVQQELGRGRGALEVLAALDAGDSGGEGPAIRKLT